MCCKPYSFLVIDATLSDVNLLCFRKKSFKNNINIIVRIDKKIRHDKLEYDIKYQYYQQIKMSKK